MAWLPKQKIVVPVDFSDDSLAAVDFALDLVADPTGLHVIHVLPELPVTEPGVIWDSVDDAGRCRHAADALREKLAKPEQASIQIEVKIGSPASEIADYAQQVAADLIVLPSHGRTGLKRLLIGSVAENVVRLAHCPVLVLRD